MKYTPDFVIMSEADRIRPRDFWQWLLLPFIVGMMTLSYVQSLSGIIILYGLMLSSLFSIYFIYNRLTVPFEVILYLGWIMWSVGGLSNAVEKHFFITMFKTIIQVGVLIFLISGITALRRSLSTTMLAIMIGGIIVAATFFTGELHHVTSLDAKMRASGITENANEFAYVLLFVIIAAAFFWKRTSSLLWRISLATVSAMSFIGVLYSGSRKGFLSVLAFIFLWWLFCRDKQKSANPLKGVLVLFVLLASFYLSVNYVLTHTYLGDRLQHLSNSGDEKRIAMYKEGFQMIENHPFFGVGLDNYRALSSTGLYSHSDYIEVASTTGIVGFILYFSIYLVIWIRLSHLKKLTADPQVNYIVGLFKAAIITMLMLGFGRPNINSKLTWIFLAAVIGYSWSEERFLVRFYRKYANVATMSNDAKRLASLKDQRT